MKQPILVRQVDSKRDYQKFFELPWQIYKDDPNWVAPLRSLRDDMLNRSKNAAWQYLQGEYFIAERDGKVVGSIAALINPRHNDFWHEQTGFFGVFESIDDPHVSAALFKTAEDWLRGRGMTVIRGPVTLTVWEEYGMLIDGFEPPVFLMPYHPPYYQALVERAGYAKAVDLYSYYFTWDMLKENGIEERFEKLSARILRGGNIKVRAVDGKHLQEEFVTFQQIFNDAWKENYGFVPMSDEERIALADSIGLIFDPELACVVEVNGEPAAFAISIPDINQALRHVNVKPHQPNVLNLLKLLWHWKLRRKTDHARLPLLGVREEYRKLGVDLLMYKYVTDAMRRNGYGLLDAGWVLENNPKMAKLLENMGMNHYRTYRLYEKPLT